MLHHTDLLFFLSFCVYFLKYLFAAYKKNGFGLKGMKIRRSYFTVYYASNRETNRDRISFPDILYLFPSSIEH